MRFLVGVLMLLVSGSALATIDVMPFKDEAQEQQFRRLTEQLRCPKCQNNSIADSNAMIATDMRRKVYDLMQEGKSNKEIVGYMVARYGNFVTYDPPLTPLTVLLWVLPLAAIVAGGWIIVARTRRLVSRDHTDIRVLSLYAFSAFEQGRFGEAVAAWEMMLKLLPADDARRAVIERSIRQALAQEK
ncbi:cytochrome c-type biogenesis protein CcmH [Salmonella enterica]|nr:cytochrome c-type biogenesis protein CcmH [Salmonella enterica]EIR5380555.1 cytochrome c-type biogenesis protein CcmH [Salmonella enterica]